MSDHTPTTDAVRTAYAILTKWARVSTRPSTEVVEAEFDRWLAEHDAEVIREAAAKLRADEKADGGNNAVTSRQKAAAWLERLADD